ncbi:MAG: fimbrillin family protein, partial [Bacteroidales bacterium]|nr:fimbrillin family protein [Bacteroidales bacterium]
MKRIFILLALSALAASCGKGEMASGRSGEVTLGVTVVNDEGDTRAPYRLTVPTADDPVTAAIWASTTSKSYRGSQTEEPGPDATIIDYHNSTCFTSGTRQLLDHQLFYPSNKAKVYFVGFCPRSEDGWAVEGASYNIARYEFDGKTDVMYAAEASSNIELSAMDLQLQFRHILTWLRFNVVADKDAIEAWGRVKKITLVGNKQVKINVTDNTCSFDQPNQQFPTYCTQKGVFTDSLFHGQSIELTTSPQEVAYTMCGAVNAAAGDGENEYTVTIETEYRPETSGAINLKTAGGANFSGLTEGKQFTVTLRFKLGDNVTVSACVSEWKNGGIGVAPIEE